MKNANLLDQFFLKDQKIVEDFISAAELKKSDVVLEIGAGNGILTKVIAKKAGKTTAVEIDSKFKKELSGIGAGCRLIFDDILTVLKNKSKYNLKFNKIIGSLPSSIIEPLMGVLLKTDFESAVFLVPLKLIHKLMAHAPYVFYFDFEIIKKVPRKSFFPVPKTNWALIKMVKKENLKINEFLQKYVYLHPKAKKENALREGLISYYKAQGKKLTKNQAREIIKSEKPAESAGFI